MTLCVDERRLFPASDRGWLAGTLWPFGTVPGGQWVAHCGRCGLWHLTYVAVARSMVRWNRRK